MSVQSILVSQPRPENEKSPYFALADKYKLKIDFRSFIHVEGIEGQEFRKERINLADHTGIILTSRNAVDHYFRIAEEMRYTVPDSMKYFCISEAVAYYLQKYVVYRKRKIFHGKRTIKDMTDILKKHKTEKFLVPCSDIQRKIIPQQLDELGLDYTNATLYKTVCSDLSDLEDVKYDMLVFFSPSGIESLYKNFPKFEQNGTKIAVYGNTTATAVEKAGLRIDVRAPQPEFPSMTMAIEKYVKDGKKGR
ncbi:MAG TPA: uroporphyrinogen-III synthase [Flavobacteriales bacterium]|jgi:uroporphyrinogen-III synthase|nr:uroporphyrinogen-III synthase [Flavobacteriales bacterium]|tara:strand:+ start:1411 stop:2160 length:750 start_codon:yes stop_codon:yes gene_type:complete